MRAFWVAENERSHTNMRDQFAAGCVSFFKLLLGYPALSRRKKKKVTEKQT